ncbi:LysR family transcriptional regulator, partial [Vibrio sp. 10N.222.55.C6]
PHSNLFSIHNYPNLRAIDIDIASELKMVGVYSHIHTKNRNSPLHMWLCDVVQQALNEQINK